MRRVGKRGLLGIAVAVATAVLCLFAVPASAEQQDQIEDPSVLHATFRSFPDYMDPQLSYTSEGWEAMYDTYIPLLTYKHASGRKGSEIVPGLAKEMPRITNGGKTYTLFLRKGLRYSNGAPVRASDFAYTVRRMFRLFSGGAVFYTDIVGTWQLFQTGRGRLRGVTTDNKTGKIVIHLRRPNGTFLDALALPFAALVPPSTPMALLFWRPPPATGPYVIDKMTPGRGWSYARNPAWEGSNEKLLPQLPPGHVDKIEVEVIRDDEEQVEGIKQGRFDWMQNPPPANRFPSLARKYEGTQFRIEPTLSTYYFWMNTRKAPFNDLRVRKAVNYAVDTSALQRIYAEQIAPTHQILPPDMPGYRKYNLYSHNMAKARKLIKKAHPGDRKITVWTDSESPNNKAGAYYASVLRQLGFHARLKVVNADNYFTVIGNTSTPDLDTGWSDWFVDYAHPNDWFQPMLAGSSILHRYNGNFAQIDVPSLNSKLAGLFAKPLGPAQERRYAALDRSYMKLAPWVPYGTRMLSTFVSRRVDLGKVVWNPSFGADLASFQFK